MSEQKNYRDFTVGELLDMGFKVEVSKHGVESIEKGKELTKLFEGTKRSTTRLSDNLRIANTWKGQFKATFYVREPDVL